MSVSVPKRWRRSIPVFVTRNANGEIEGVKYDRLSVVFVNAFKEQQRQIELQQKQIEEQKISITNLQSEVEMLKNLICTQTPSINFCIQEKRQ